MTIPCKTRQNKLIPSDRLKQFGSSFLSQGRNGLSLSGRSGVRPSIGLFLTMLIALTTQCGATEFIVMRLPTGWAIGADSLETRPNAPKKTVCKIQEIAKFVVLRYGAAGQTSDPSFDLNKALEEAISPTRTQKEAFKAARSVLDAAMVRTMRAHQYNKQIQFPGTLPDSPFARDVAIGFILLSIEGKIPQIDSYVVSPGDYASMTVRHYQERFLGRTKMEYVPVGFSGPNILDQLPFAKDQSKLRKDPAEAIGLMLKAVGDYWPEGVGPPYVTGNLTKRGLSFTTAGPCAP